MELKKASSPVVTVLVLTLIAFVASIIIYTWSSGFITEETGGSERNVLSQMLKLEGISVTRRFGDLAEVEIYLRNIGSVEAKIDMIYIESPGGLAIIAKNISKTIIPPKSLEEITFIINYTNVKPYVKYILHISTNLGVYSFGLTRVDLYRLIKGAPIKLPLPVYAIYTTETVNGESLRWHYTKPEKIFNAVKQYADLYVISTYRDLYNFIYNSYQFLKDHPGWPIEKVIIINCHGEVIPYAGPYDNLTLYWKSYLEDLRRTLVARKIIFVNVGGWFAYDIEGAYCTSTNRPITFLSYKPKINGSKEFSRTSI